MDKQFVVTIRGNAVYINNTYRHFSTYMDTDREIDLDKKALVALVNEMGYEPIFMFEEMADRLDAMLDKE